MPNWNYPLITNNAGAEVDALHAFLKKLNGDFAPDMRFVVPPTTPPSLTPFYGPQTKAAVKAIQVAHGIDDSGDVNWVTGHLIAWAVEVVDSKFNRALALKSFGNELIGPDVAELRKELVEWRKAEKIGDQGAIENDRSGSGNARPDVYGPNLAAAIRAFKKAVGLSDDSIANEITFKTLWRLRFPLAGDPFKVAGTVSAGAGVTVDLYAKTTSSRFLVARGTSGAGGAFELSFNVHKTSTGPAAELPLSVYARIGDRLLESAKASIAFKGDGTFNPASAVINAPNHILVGLVVRPDDKESVPQPNVSVRALATELNQAANPMTLEERKEVASATSDADGIFELAFNAPSSDVRVEAFAGNKVLAVSPLLFNLRPMELGGFVVCGHQTASSGVT